MAAVVVFLFVAVDMAALVGRLDLSLNKSSFPTSTTSSRSISFPRPSQPPLPTPNPDLATTHSTSALPREANLTSATTRASPCSPPWPCLPRRRHSPAVQRQSHPRSRLLSCRLPPRPLLSGSRSDVRASELVASPMCGGIASGLLPRRQRCFFSHRPSSAAPRTAALLLGWSTDMAEAPTSWKTTPQRFKLGGLRPRRSPDIAAFGALEQVLSHAPPAPREWVPSRMRIGHARVRSITCHSERTLLNMCATCVAEQWAQLWTREHMHRGGKSVRTTAGFKMSASCGAACKCRLPP